MKQAPSIWLKFLLAAWGMSSMMALVYQSHESSPALAVSPGAIDVGSTLVNSKTNIELSLSDESGNGIRRLKILPDCSCFVAAKLPTEILPGESVAFSASIHWSSLGDARRTVQVAYGDELEDRIDVHISANVLSRYRWESDAKPLLTRLEQGDLIELSINSVERFNIYNARIDGWTGDVAVEWGQVESNGGHWSAPVWIQGQSVGETSSSEKRRHEAPTVVVVTDNVREPTFHIPLQASK